jgi:maltose O-acetyltransferase
LDLPVSAKTKMMSGELYDSTDPALEADRKRAKTLCAKYNASAGDIDRATLTALVGCETDAYFEPPFFCDYGYNLRLGRGVYANHNLVVLDCALVSLGDNVLIAPNVVITARLIPSIRRCA